MTAASAPPQAETWVICFGAGRALNRSVSWTVSEVSPLPNVYERSFSPNALRKPITAKATREPGGVEIPHGTSKTEWATKGATR